LPSDLNKPEGSLVTGKPAEELITSKMLAPHIRK